MEESGIIFHPHIKHLGSRYALTSTCNNANTIHTPIIIDTGVSISICCCIDDFIGDLRPSGATIQGIGSSLSVGGIGTVAWTVFDINNVEVTITTEAFYVPGANVNLFSPQFYITEDIGKRSKMVLDKSGVTVTTHSGIHVNFPFHF